MQGQWRHGILVHAGALLLYLNRPFLNVEEDRMGGLSTRSSFTKTIHPTFHVSYLKRKVGAQVQPLVTLPPVATHGEILPDPQAIVGRQMRKLGDRAVTEFLVKWVGASDEDNSWEGLWKLRQLYMHLVYKVLKGRRFVRTLKVRRNPSRKGIAFREEVLRTTEVVELLIDSSVI